MNKEKIKLYVFEVLASLLTTSALTMNLKINTVDTILKNMGMKGSVNGFFWKICLLIEDIKMSINGYSILALTLFCVFFYFYHKHFGTKDRKLIMCAIIPALLFSFFMVFGYSFKQVASWSLIFDNYRNMVKASIVFVGYTILFFQLICFGFEKAKNTNVCATRSDKEWFTNNKKSILVVAGIILLIWSPYLISAFPGLTNYDFFDMLDSFYGHETYSLRAVTLIDPSVTLNNNNPVLQTLMAVGFMKIGSMIGVPAFGLFLFCFGQAICFAFILSYVIYYLAKCNVDSRIRVALLLIFGIVPIHANYAITTLKDTNFSFIFLLYIISLIEIVRLKEEYFKDKKKMLWFSFLTLVLMLLRNNGLYVILLTAIIMIIVYRKHWKKIILPLFIPIIIYQVVIVNMLFPYFKIAPGSKREAFSIPFQQTARLVKEHGEEIGEEDAAIINKVLDYDSIAKRYNPELSDKVKATYKKECSSEDFNDYLGIWAKWLFIHPDTYVQATMSNCYGYFYPEAKSWLTYTEITSPGKRYGVESPATLKMARLASTHAADVFRKIPGIGLLESIGFYTWILILCVSYLLYANKKENIMMMVPILILLLTCIAGPANTMMRYIYPMILCVPVFVIISLCSTSKKLEERK